MLRNVWTDSWRSIQIQYSYFQDSIHGVKLSQRDKDLVRASFPTTQVEMEEMGQWIFRFIFRKSNEIRKMFQTRLSNEDVSDWLRMHSKKFMEVVDMTVCSMDALDDTLGMEHDL